MRKRMAWLLILVARPLTAGEPTQQDQAAL